MVQKRNSIEFDIILLLLGEDAHIRGIAKRLDASHSTVLRALKRLYAEGVLDFMQEGRNNTYFIRRNLQARSYVFNAERYKQLLLFKKYPWLGVVSEDILNKADGRIVAIFGSYASFSAGKDSDVDVFVETDKRRVKEAVEAVHSMISVKIGGLDTSSQLVREIVRNHVILQGVEEFYGKIGFFGQAPGRRQAEAGRAF